MDCISVKIIDKIKNLEEMNPPNYDELARYYVRLFEYHLRLMFACLWDRKSQEMPTKKYLRIVQTMDAPTCGTEWSIVKELNELGEPLFTLDKKYKTLLDNFISLRNDFIHEILDSETFSGKLGKLKWYQNLVEFEQNILGDDCEFLMRPNSVEQGQIIAFQSNQNNRYRNVEKIIASAYQQNELYFHCKAGRFKVSPFLMLFKRSNSDYYFYYFHHYDCQSGKFDYYYMPEIKNDSISKTFPAFFNARQQIDKQITRYVNGIVANDFENNYDYFLYDIKPFDKYVTQIWSALINAQANICITISGGGGVGKTALAQYICTKLLGDITANPKFNYVIFCSAKTKAFRLNISTERGQIYPVAAEKIISSYAEILRIACRVLRITFEHDENFSKIEEAILEKKGVLFVIDNFETLPEVEREKVVGFINRMQSGRHKVFITTRLKNIAGLKSSICNVERMNEEQIVAFMKERFKRIPKSVMAPFQNLLAKKTTKKRIYNVTRGLPLLTIPLALLMPLRNFSEELLPVEKNISEEVEEFLTGNPDNHFYTPTEKLLFLLIALFTKWDLQKVSVSVLRIFYELFCRRAKISGGDFATDLKAIALEDIIKIENESVSFSEYISNKIIGQYAKKILAEYPNNFFDERLFKLATATGHDKWILNYYELSDVLIDDVLTDIFARDNVCNLTNKERFWLIKKFIDKCKINGDEEKIKAWHSYGEKYFNDDKNLFGRLNDGDFFYKPLEKVFEFFH